MCEHESKHKLLGLMLMLFLKTFFENHTSFPFIIIGLTIGSLIGGQLCDKFGRKKILLSSILVAFLQRFKELIQLRYPWTFQLLSNVKIDKLFSDALHLDCNSLYNLENF